MPQQAERRLCRLFRFQGLVLVCILLFRLLQNFTSHSVLSVLDFLVLSVDKSVNFFLKKRWWWWWGEGWQTPAAIRL